MSKKLQACSSYFVSYFLSESEASTVPDLRIVIENERSSANKPLESDKQVIKLSSFFLTLLSLISRVMFFMYPGT